MFNITFYFYRNIEFTEYRGEGPSCSDDSLPGSLPPCNNDMSSFVERFRQFPIFSFACIDFDEK